MEARSLRIGNLLNYIGKPYEVSSVHYDNTIRFFLKEKTGTFGCFRIGVPSIQPIPLTEEWLLKFGFSKYGNSIYLIKDNSDYQISSNGSYFKIFHDQLSPFYGVEIKYVHQLQNLYFRINRNRINY